MSVTQRTQRTIGVLMALFVASSCNLTPDVREGAAAMPAAVGGGGELYNRLGGEMGIRKVVTDFVGRVAGDPRINGYFLNSNVGVQRVIDCLVIQVGSLTGAGYPYPSSGCRDMKTVHTNMGVSKADFDDTAGHLVAALTAAGVAQADISAIIAAVATTAPDIIEDPNNNKTVYQRVGRKPAIEAVVVAFLTDAFDDPRINGFFAGGNADAPANLPGPPGVWHRRTLQVRQGGRRREGRRGPGQSLQGHAHEPPRDQHPPPHHQGGLRRRGAGPRRGARSRRRAGGREDGHPGRPRSALPGHRRQRHRLLIAGLRAG